MNAVHKQTVNKREAEPLVTGPRLHFVFIDGLGDGKTAEGTGITNVLKFYQLLSPDLAGRQIARYHRGFDGGETGGVRSWLRNFVSGSEGHRLVRAAYARIVQDWLPGDVLMIYAFGRRAAIARALVNKLVLEGIPEQITTFSRPRTNPETRNVEPAFLDYAASRERLGDVRIGFLGLWDTVATGGFSGKNLGLGYPLNIPAEVERTVHAVALDETRNALAPELIDSPSHFIEEVWFPGAHEDVGGGYPEEENALSRETLRFMMERTFRWLRTAQLPVPLMVSNEVEQNLAVRPAQPRVFHFQGLGLLRSPRDIHASRDTPPAVHASVLELQQATSPLLAKPGVGRPARPFSHYQPFNLKQRDGDFTVVS